MEKKIWSKTVINDINKTSLIRIKYKEIYRTNMHEERIEGWDMRIRTFTSTIEGNFNVDEYPTGN